RREGIRKEYLDVRVPADDVHLLVVQFADDVLNPLTAQTDACADGINLFVPSIDRELGAEPRLAGNALDLGGSIIDFRDFQMKKLYDKPWIGPRKDNLRPMWPVFNGLHVATNSFANLVFFCRHAFAVR